MGASEFLTYQAGIDAEQAFRTAVADAQLWHGARGYTGTIAEKAVEGFVVVSAEPCSLDQAETMAAGILAGDDEDWAEIRDKRGRAGAIAVLGERRDHHAKIPVVPGGHADLDAAVAAATVGRLVAGEQVVLDEVSGSYRRDGVRVQRDVDRAHGRRPSADRLAVLRRIAALTRKANEALQIPRIRRGRTIGGRARAAGT
ncbi:hypothetical protein [Amycolatopsis sp. NPDC004079]|uniref:hypothetical protein n=1 Tax=Amycolatopsis sp. NPDC004079 TaxID=3154549 RepID=UPI0033BB86C0